MNCTVCLFDRQVDALSFTCEHSQRAALGVFTSDLKSILFYHLHSFDDVTTAPVDLHYLLCLNLRTPCCESYS